MVLCPLADDIVVKMLRNVRMAAKRKLRRSIRWCGGRQLRAVREGWSDVAFAKRARSDVGALDQSGGQSFKQ